MCQWTHNSIHLPAVQAARERGRRAAAEQSLKGSFAAGLRLEAPTAERAPSAGRRLPLAGQSFSCPRCDPAPVPRLSAIETARLSGPFLVPVRTPLLASEHLLAVRTDGVIGAGVGDVFAIAAGEGVGALATV
jgi:hypothetical protein